LEIILKSNLYKFAQLHEHLLGIELVKFVSLNRC